jgi:hypothetical protein
MLIGGRDGYSRIRRGEEMVVSLAVMIAGHVLYIDGVLCGRVMSPEGGGGVADVIEEPPSAGW